MLPYPLSQYKSSSSWTPPSSSSNESMESLNDAPKRKSLTPQRKHHKLLKDGNEVWSQEVEKIFVDGLHKYWESPWATYSRGRSRWRNQFLVEHLKKNGIDRSKKQVASHIQVLRNMWRGEPEFHLVAGGEELFQENGLLASPKSNASTDSPEPAPPANLDASDWRSSWSSSASSALDISAFELPFDLGASSSSSAPQLSPLAPRVPIMDYAAGPSTSSLPSNAAFAAITPATAGSHARTSSVKLEPLALDPALFNLPQGSLADTLDFPYIMQATAMPNRVCGMNLWADNSPLSMIDIDRLTSASMVASASNQPPPSFRILLRLHLKFPPGNVNGPPQFQGVHGALSFASRWTTTAKCHTKVWAGKTCVSHEVGVFEQLSAQQFQTGVPGGSASSSMVIAYFPESALSRCRWLEPTIQTITQQIVVDKEVLAVIIYTLDRSVAAGVAPTVELVGFHKYPWRMPMSSQPLTSPPVSPSLFPTTYSSPAVPHAPHMTRPPNSGQDNPPPFIPSSMFLPSSASRHPV